MGSWQNNCYTANEGMFTMDILLCKHSPVGRMNPSRLKTDEWWCNQVAHRLIEDGQRESLSYLARAVVVNRWQMYCIICCSIAETRHFVISSPEVGIITVVTSLGDDIFVLRSWGRYRLQVYDANTFKFWSYIAVSGIHSSLGIAACDYYECLYVSGNSKSIHRVDLRMLEIETVKTWNVANIAYLLVCQWTVHIIWLWHAEEWTR